MGNYCCYTRSDRLLNDEKLDIVMELSRNAYSSLRKHKTSKNISDESNIGKKPEFKKNIDMMNTVWDRQNYKNS